MKETRTSQGSAVQARASPSRVSCDSDAGDAVKGLPSHRPRQGLHPPAHTPCLQQSPRGVLEALPEGVLFVFTNQLTPLNGVTASRPRGSWPGIGSPARPWPAHRRAEPCGALRVPACVQLGYPLVLPCSSPLSEPSLPTSRAETLPPHALPWSFSLPVMQQTRTGDSGRS